MKTAVLFVGAMTFATTPVLGMNKKRKANYEDELDERTLKKEQKIQNEFENRKQNKFNRNRNDGQNKLNEFKNRNNKLKNRDQNDFKDGNVDYVHKSQNQEDTTFMPDQQQKKFAFGLDSYEDKQMERSFQNSVKLDDILDEEEIDLNNDDDEADTVPNMSKVPLKTGGGFDMGKGKDSSQPKGKQLKQSRAWRRPTREAKMVGRNPTELDPTIKRNLDYHLNNYAVNGWHDMLRPNADEFVPGAKRHGDSLAENALDELDVFEDYKSLYMVEAKDADPESPEGLLLEYLTSNLDGDDQEDALFLTFQTYMDIAGPEPSHAQFMYWFVEQHKQAFAAWLDHRLRGATPKTRESIHVLAIGFRLRKLVKIDLAEFSEECDGNCILISMLVRGEHKLVPLEEATI